MGCGASDQHNHEYNEHLGHGTHYGGGNVHNTHQTGNKLPNDDALYGVEVDADKYTQENDFISREQVDKQIEEQRKEEERERLEKEYQEEERKRQEEREKEQQDQEQGERERQEQEQREREQQEQEQREREQQEQEQREREQQEQEQRERERQEQEQREREQQEQEQREREQQEQEERERREQEERERQQREEQDGLKSESSSLAVLPVPVPPPMIDDEASQTKHEFEEEDDYVPSFPDFGNQYKKTHVNTFEAHINFRQDPIDYEYDERPRFKGDLYTDPDFSLRQALPTQYSKYEWKRPTEIRENPCLFSEGTTRYDIGQGSIGTCWFLSMVSNVADRPELIKQLIPKGAYRVGTPGYDGVFHCRFWRYGSWDDVYIDDYLPIVYGTEISSAHSATDKDEMWVSLLEKAFARSYGSYEAVTGGLSADAFLALTGGVPEMIDHSKMKMSPEELFCRITNALHSGAMVACSVPDENDNVKGLVGGHAYSLTGTGKAPQELLVRVRNPWGNHEWTGAWSDGSAEWNSVPPNTIQIPNKDDGEFYMSLNDFITMFSDTTICCLTPDFDRDGSSDTLNYVTCIYGDWRGKNAAGFQKKIENPKYLIELTDDSVDEHGKCPVVIHLIQRTLRRKKDHVNIRCDLYKVLYQEDGKLVVEEIGEKNNHYKADQQVVFRHHVTPGQYVIVPSTMDPGQEKEFLVRIFSPAPLFQFNKYPARDLTNESLTIMECGCEPYPKLAVSTRIKQLQVLSGRFNPGSNAGGQISHETVGNNPQYEVNVQEETFVRFSLMQPRTDRMGPLGFKMFRMNGDALPMTKEWLWDHYSDGNYVQCMCDNDDGKFVNTDELTMDYQLSPGTYGILTHQDSPTDDAEFTLLVRSVCPVSVTGYNLQ